MGPEQSLFITTRTKEQTPFIFNIGFYLFLAAFCLSCPLKTYIMKKTKLIPLKVSKLYFYDPNKPSAVPVPSQAINGPTTAQERVINSTQSLKSEFDKMNTMEPTSNDFPHSRSVENLNYQKVLLDSVTSRHNTGTPNTTNKNTDTQAKTDTTKNTDTAIAEKLGTLGKTQYMLMSPVFGPGNKTFLLSPMHDSRSDTQTPSKLLLVPIENIDVQDTTTLNTKTLHPQADNSLTRLHGKRDKHKDAGTVQGTGGQERVTDNSYSLFLQQNNLTSYQPQNRGYKQWNTMVRNK